MDKETYIKLAGKKYSNRYLACLFGLLFIVMILPILYAGKYNYAAADDYAFGAPVRQAVQSGASVWGILRAAVQNTAQIYMNWQGTYATTFMQSFMPEAFDLQASFVVPFIMLGALTGSTFLLLRYIFVRILQTDRYTAVSVILIQLFICIQFLPSPGETFYWYNGSMAYTFAYAVLLVTVYGVLRYIREKRPVYLLMAVCGSLFVAGSNYLTLVLLPVLLVLMVLVFAGEGKNIWFILWLIAVFAAAAWLNIKAPGTWVRGGADFGFDLHLAAEVIEMAVYRGSKLILDYLFYSPVTIGCYILTEAMLLSAMAVRLYAYRFRYPFLFTLLTFGGYLAMFAPGYYGGVGAPFGRMENIIFFYFHLCLLLNLVYWNGYLLLMLRRICGENRIGKPIWTAVRFWNNIKSAVVLCSLAMLLLSPDLLERLTTVRAIRYLAGGEAAKLGEQMEERYRILGDASVQDAVLDPVTASTGVLFMYDITEDPQKWPNTAVKHFFQKESVRLNSGMSESD